MNTLFYGDNLNILRRYIESESVDLVYLDPLFNSTEKNRVREESGQEKNRVRPAILAILFLLLIFQNIAGRVGIRN